MAESPQKPQGFFASLQQLGRSVVDLARAFKGDASVSSDRTEGRSEDAPSSPLALPAPGMHGEDAQLLTQHTPGWHTPVPATLPVPTYAPAMTAFGIVFIALGAVTVWPLSVVGAFIFVLAIAKWIGELLS